MYDVWKGALNVAVTWVPNFRGWKRVSPDDDNHLLEYSTVQIVRNMLHSVIYTRDKTGVTSKTERRPVYVQ
jgi:hypothetical protein